MRTFPCCLLCIALAQHALTPLILAEYYQTPRIWLTGYDEHRMPLTPQQSLEDVSHEHARKTVTIDGHPHTGVPSVSIHPCRHGAVMKRIADQMAEGGAEPLLEHYLFLFLRFCATAVPTIEYDYTGACPCVACSGLWLTMPLIAVSVGRGGAQQ